MTNQSFFVPGAVGGDHEKAYVAIVMFAESNGFRVDGERIFAVDFTFNSMLKREVVGQRSPVNGEIVLAILGSEGRCLVCTVSQGGMRDDPMVVEPRDVQRVHPFYTNQ